MIDARPYLSVVASTRNDNHGGDLTRRTQIFIDALVAQAARHRVETELILVEWNPPPDRPPLAAELRWPEDNPWCAIRIITVGPEIHRRFGYSDRLPMFQMMAKNAGVRRAAGRFVLHTNIDIVFSDAIFAWIAGRSLRPGVVYRCDRVDVDRECPGGRSADRAARVLREPCLEDWPEGWHVGGSGVRRLPGRSPMRGSWGGARPRPRHRRRGGRARLPRRA